MWAAQPGREWLCGGSDLETRSLGRETKPVLDARCHNNYLLEQGPWCTESRVTLLTILRFEVRALNLSSGLGEGATGVRGSDTAQNASADPHSIQLVRA